jgi:hypothetical protein
MQSPELSARYVRSVRWLLFVLAFTTTGFVACGDGEPASNADAGEVPTAASASTAVSAPTSGNREELLEFVLVKIEDLPNGRIGGWRVSDTPMPTSWNAGPCGKTIAPTPIAAVRTTLIELGGNLSDQPFGRGYLAQAVMLLPAGTGDDFMANVATAADECDLELDAQGGALMGGGAHFPQIQSESQAYNLERFSCCYTPAAEHEADPHDIVYIRRGDIVIHLYGTMAGGLFSDVGVLTEQRVEQVEAQLSP